MTIDFTWIDPDDGETALGQSSQSKVKSFSGLGYAPLTHFLQGVPSQDRQLHRGLKYKPRIVQLGIWDHRATATAQGVRQGVLLRALNASRGEGVLKAVLSDGSTTRYLACYVQEGPDFASEDRPVWGAHQFYIVRFVARDPFLYNPTQQSMSTNFNGATAVTRYLTNSGHVVTYPVLTITGAVEDAKITLDTTGEYVELDYSLGSGDHIDIDCQAGTIKLNDVTDMIGYLTKPSTLFDLPVGAQTLTLTATAGTGAFAVTWYDRYLGLGIPRGIGAWIIGSTFVVS